MADLPPQINARTSAAGATYPQEQNRTFEGQVALRTVTREAAFFLPDMIGQPQGLARSALAEGWLDQATADAMADDLQVWGERPDAFYAGPWCEAIAWVDG